MIDINKMRIHYTKLIFISFLLIFKLTHLYAVKGWEPPVLVSENRGNNGYPDIAFYKNYYSIVWVQLQKNKTKICFSLSTNYGKTWGDIETVSVLNIHKIVKPAIIINNGFIIIGVSNEENNIDIYYREITSVSNTFKKFPVLSSDYILLLPYFIVYKNDLYLFYQENYNDKIFKIKTIRNKGAITNWSSPEDIIEYKKKVVGSFFPEIKTYNNKLYLIWCDRYGKENFRNDVVFLKTFDKATGWGNTYLLSDTSEYAVFPTFYMEKNEIYLIYFSKIFKETEFIFILKNKIFEKTTIAPIQQNTIKFPFSEYYQTTLLKHRDKFYLLWYAYKERKANIFYSTSINFTNWEEPVQITSGGKKNWNFKALKTGKEIILVYQKKYKNKSLIYFQKSDESCASPIVYSPTHKTNVWSYNNSVTIRWRMPSDPSGIKGFAYAFDTNFNTIPEIENLSGEINGRTFKQVGDGIFYFHLRAIDGVGNWSDTVHYKVMINTNPPEPPLIFSDTHQEIVPTENRSPHFYWKMKDNRPIKGFSYLLTQDKNLEPDNKINIRKTNIQFKNIEPGVWYFMVKACDPLGRWSDYATYTITIEEMVIATGFIEEVKSRYFYKVQKGEVLDKILKDILNLKEPVEPRYYEKSVGRFNYMQNLDFIKPGDSVMFPIIIASPGDTREKIAQKVFGNAKLKEKVVVINKKEDEPIVPGDKIIIKDKYFLKTGEIKGTKATGVYKKENIKK